MAKFIKRNQTEVDFDLQKIDQAVGRAAEDIGCKLNTGEFHTKLLDILAVGENTVVTYRQLLDGIRETLQALQLAPVWQAYDHYAHRRDQVRDQLMIADENKGTGDVTDRGLLLVSSGSNMDMHKWDRKRIVLKLQQLMPEVPKAEAEIVAKQVENKLVLGDYSYVNTSLITAMVNVELTKRGYTPMPEMSTYTVDAEFIENLCCTKNLENSNVVSNTPETVSENLAEYILKSYALDHVFSKEVANAHVTGRIQLHDLGLPTRVYCSAHSIEYLKKYGLRGLINLNTESKPAKSASVLTGHLNTFMASMQANYAGALGLAYINTLYAPFIKGMTYDEIHQTAQELIFNASQNAFSRGSQTIFTDFNIDPGVAPSLLETPVIGPGGKYLLQLDQPAPLEEQYGYGYGPEVVTLTEELTAEQMPNGYPLQTLRYGDVVVSRECYDPKTDTYSYDKQVIEDMARRGWKIVVYGDFQQEASDLCEALLQVFKEGDANGTQFFFPKCQFHVSDGLFKHERSLELFRKACALSSFNGSTYFVFDRSAVTMSACCRLLTTITDPTVLKHPERIRFNGFANHTINIPHCAYLAKRDQQADPSKSLLDYFYQELHKSFELAVQAHQERRAFIRKMMAGPGRPLWQVAKIANDGRPYIEIDKSTYIIGTIGLNDAIQFMTGEQLHESTNARRLGHEIIAQLFLWTKEKSKELHLKFSVEETPAESAARRLARADLHTFPEEAQQVVKGTYDNEYYTNSVHDVADAPESLVDRIIEQSKYHPVIESGAIIHAFVGENCPDARAIEELVTNVFRRTQCAQLTISPEYTYCQSCHQRMSGLRDRCPHCGSEDTMGITRVVGYFSIVRNWNKSKKYGELKARQRGDYAVMA